MRPRLKPLLEQVIVITGATSGIGLSTARAASARGAAVVLAARNEQALKTVCSDLTSKGGKAHYVVADVGVQADVERIALEAVKRFGGFDTWVNNAGVAIFGDLTEITIEDQRRLFETNYWGVVYGSLAAVDHLRRKTGGGAVINVGSVLDEMPVPMLGAYAASKAAMKGFTRALRIDLIRARAPVSLTLIRPSAIDTPYKDHARNYTQMAMHNPPPVYATPLVAQMILHAAEHPSRDLSVGGGGAALAFLASLNPLISERIIARLAPMMLRDSKTVEPKRASNLHQAGQDLRERAWYPQVREQSLASAAQMRPLAASGIAVVATALVVAAYLAGRRLRGASPQLDS